MKDVRLNQNYNTSPGTTILKAFLEIIRLMILRVKLILLPVNGDSVTIQV